MSVHSLQLIYFNQFLHSFVRSFVHSFIHSVTHSFIHEFKNSFIHFVHLFFLSFVHSFILSFRSFNHFNSSISISSYHFIFSIHFSIHFFNSFTSFHVMFFISYHFNSLLSNSPRTPISKLVPIAMSYFRNFRPARAGHYLVRIGDFL